jgi:hypothetical protein
VEPLKLPLFPDHHVINLLLHGLQLKDLPSTFLEGWVENFFPCTSLGPGQVQVLLLGMRKTQLQVKGLSSMTRLRQLLPAMFDLP